MELFEGLSVKDKEHKENIDLNKIIKELSDEKTSSNIYSYSQPIVVNLEKSSKNNSKSMFSQKFSDNSNKDSFPSKRFKI